MNLPNPFPLGGPPREDVEAAALLLLRYAREAPLGEDEANMFMRGLADPEAVLERVRQLQAAE